MSTTTTLETTTVELRPIRLQAEESLRVLRSARQTDEVKRAIANLETILDAVKRTCGPNMMIPVHTT